jgi:plastocyanin domain-containing protein
LAAVALAGCGGASEPVPDATGRIAIEVTEKGFEPATVTVERGRPVTLVVTRTTTKTCATELVVKEHDIHRELPLGERTEVTFTPQQPGELRFACAMDMIAGKVVVK